MKAAVYHETGAPSVLRYEDVPDPEPAAGEVLIRVGAVGIQGGDTLNRQGGQMPRTPHIVGYQAAGTVVGLGEGTTGFAEGDRVVCSMNWGSHAELAVGHATRTWHVPDGLSIEAAATVPVEFGTADDCLFHAGRLQAGETAVILAGASGVGLAAVQLAKAAGATVIATASGPEERREKLKDYGADHVIDYVNEDLTEAILALTRRKGADVIVDPVGGRALAASVQAMAYRARIAFVGMAAREENLVDAIPFLIKNASLIGVFLGGEMEHDTDRIHAMIDSLLARCAAGELVPVIDRSFPLSEAAAAHEYIESRAALGRVILVP
jgi:NADPH2:quinone reductase